MAEGYELLKEKVPEFRTPWKALSIITGWVLLSAVWLVFFWWFDSIAWYNPLVSQSIVAVICTGFACTHMKNAGRYREKYKEKAYRNFFFHFIVPIFATWYALMFHPLLVSGEPLLPFWAAAAIGVFFFSFRPLTSIHISKAGFDNIGHGFGIYTVYPEEGPTVSSEIYSYIRHPMYLGSFCAALGFAFLRNNVIALLTAIIFLIPAMVEIRLEDNEMIRRAGEEHETYIKNTGALFPHKNVVQFFKLLFLGRSG